MGVPEPIAPGVQYPESAPRPTDIEKQDVHTGPVRGSDSASVNSEDFQQGVIRARAAASVWDTKTLITLFVLLYMVNFVSALLSAVQASLNPYITSTWGEHGLIAALDVLSTILSGCTTLALAKVANVFGRIESFSSMWLITIIGLIMKAKAESVQVYVAAHVLYWVGYIGLLYVVNVMLADMTTLRNRMVVFGINATPTICSSFAGPKIAALFFDHLNFRWAFGSFAIILSGFCLPCIIVLFLAENKARKQGLIAPRNTGRTLLESAKYYAIEFDIVGTFLIIAAWAFLLLPFSLVGRAPHGWKTGYIIAFIIVGAFLFPVFYIWERKYATVTFIPWKYLQDPTIIGSCLLYAIMFLSTYCWNTYFYSYVLVINRLGITTASYVVNSYALSSSIISPFVGWLIRTTGDFKFTAFAGVPIMLLGTCLLIPFRTPDTVRALVVLTQVLVGVGSGFFVMAGQLAVMVPVTQQEVASTLAIYSMFGSLGASVGIAISGGIWGNTLYKELVKSLPADLVDQAATIYGSIEVQLSFADGTPGRDAVVHSYGTTERYMVIAGVCFMPLCFLSIWVWRNINVKRLAEQGHFQTKGNVF